MAPFLTPLLVIDPAKLNSRELVALRRDGFKVSAMCPRCSDDLHGQPHVGCDLATEMGARDLPPVKRWAFPRPPFTPVTSEWMS